MSKKWRLNVSDFERQLRSALVWLAPMALVYLGQLMFGMKESGVLKMEDFYPDSQTVGAIQLYFINQLWGLLNKLRAGK